MKLAAVLVAALALAGPAAAGVRISGVDTSGYPEVRVSVVAPLGSAQPSLREDGAPVAALQGANLGREKSVVLAVDRSQSMRGEPLGQAAAAARAFVAAAGAADRFEVVAFGHEALTLTRFAAGRSDTDAALAGLTTDGREGTALWDAVVRAAHDLRNEVGSGRVILLVTDGSDVSSEATFAQAVAAAQRADAAVYPIGIGSRGFDPGPLRQLAAATGGTYLHAASSGELAALYAAIERTLGMTWQLSYDTAARPGERVSLSVEAGSERGERAVALPDVGGQSAAPGSPSVLPASVWRSPYLPFAFAAAVGLLAFLALRFGSAARSGSWVQARLAPHLGPQRASVKRRRRRENRPLLSGLLSATDGALGETRPFRALQSILVRADLPLLAAELLYLCLGAGVVAAIVAALARLGALIVLAAMAAGASGPVLWVVRKAHQRMKAFDNQLPDLLITIAASLKAGHSFRHAIQAVVDEGAEPAAKEFRRVLTDTRLGRPMDEALSEMGERIGSKNLSFVLTSVSIQRQIGGSLAGLFDMVAETVRQRQQFARKIRSLTAMGRMSAYVLGALPFFMAALISLISPSYMAPLWHSGTGHELVGVALVMLAIGGVVLKRIVSFKG